MALSAPGVDATTTTIGRFPSMLAAAPAGDRFYAIQVGASKVLIPPDQYRKKLGLNEEVRYFTKDGWYKYYIGRFETEAEAKQQLGRLKIKGFVTRVEGSAGPAEVPTEKAKPSTVQPEKPAVVEEEKNEPEQPTEETSAEPAQDTERAPVIRESSSSAQKPDMGFKELYFKKIREADSLFNRQSNLKKARTLYREASSLAPEKTYPRDQIVEIDKLLNYRDSQGFFSKLSQTSVIIGFLVVFFLTIVVIYFINRRKPPKSPKPNTRPKTRSVTGANRPAADIPVGQKQAVDESTSPVGGDVLDQVLEWSPSLNKYLKNLPYAEESDRSNPEVLIHEIKNALNSDQAVLRMESELALMRLNPEDPLALLDLLKQEFTPYEQVHVYEAVRRLNLPIPDFHRWTSSGNPAVALFCSRMVQVFRQDVRPVDPEVGPNQHAHPEGEAFEWLSLAGPGFQDCAEHYFSSRIRQEFFGGF